MTVGNVAQDIPAELVKASGAVEFLDRDRRTYDEVWGATVHCAQNFMASEVGYWLGLYRIKRDMLWQEAGFNDQEEWIFALAHTPRFLGGCAESTFHAKMTLIDNLVDSGVSPEMIVHALAVPTATSILMKHRDRIPEGHTVQTVLEATSDQNPGQATVTVGEILGLNKTWVSQLSFDLEAQKLSVAISEESGTEVDTRRYVIYNIPYEDAEFLARQLHKLLEV